MKDVMERVVAEKADLGIGFDGDGDRVGVVDEKGAFYQSDFLLIPVARDVLARNPGASIIFDMKSSYVLEDDIRLHGGKPVRYKTGHSFIETKMRETGAPLAGETSGHIFFAENWFGFDDGMYAVRELLNWRQEATSLFPHCLTACQKHLQLRNGKSPAPILLNFALWKT